MLVGVAIGWHVPAGIVPAVGLLLVGTVAFAGIGMLMAGTLRAEATLAAANGLFLVLLFLGGMAYPLAKLPAPLRDFAKALPAAALSETVRSVLSSRAFPVGELLVLLAWAVAAPLLAARVLPLGGGGLSCSPARARPSRDRVHSWGRTSGRAQLLRHR